VFPPGRVGQFLGSRSEDTTGSHAVVVPNPPMDFSAALKVWREHRLNQAASRSKGAKQAIETLYPGHEIQRVAMGGESIVFRVHSTETGRIRMVKIPVDPDSERVRNSYEVEANIAKQVSQIDPEAAFHLVRVEALRRVPHHDRTEVVLVLEEANGGDLGDDLKRWGPRSDAKSVLSAWKQLALAVRGIHSVGLVHRDIKPRNLLVHRTGDDATQYLLSDFGLVRRAGVPLERPGELFAGTVSHMSLNQLMGGVPAFEDDMRGLQVTFYEMLLGQSVWELVDKHLPQETLELKRIDGFGTFPWLHRLPSDAAAQVHPGLKQIAETTYTDAASLVKAIEEWERRLSASP
jgi:serine/threonine protein kinase